jgi:hypothetical protein
VLASELARLKIDVFVAAGEPALLAAKEKGENIPIVVVSCDPPNRLPTRSEDTHVNPVAFPPGRLSYLEASRVLLWHL